MSERGKIGAPTTLHLKNIPARIGIAGTGFIGAGLCRLIPRCEGMNVSKVLTRRKIDTVRGIEAELLTNSLDELIESSDLIVECSGDVLRAAVVVDRVMQAGLPVVTMCAEFHVTAGSYFCTRGLITDAEGDQPGSLAALHEEAVSMGFRPLVYGNIKGFLNHNPIKEEVEHWARRGGISPVQVTSFTDGTKMQIENALVANAFGATIMQRGMIGMEAQAIEDASIAYGRKALSIHKPIVDYVLNPRLPAGVFLVSEHPFEPPEVLRYYKLGEGPFYTLLRPYHLCHLELPRTIRRVLEGRGPLLNNSPTPRINVVAVAKEDLAAGTEIKTAIGGPEFRGEAVVIADFPDAPPIGLLSGAVLRNSVSAGQTLKLSDIDIPDSLAKVAWDTVRPK